MSDDLLSELKQAVEHNHRGYLTLAQAKYLMSGAYEAGMREASIRDFEPMTFEEWFATLYREAPTDE